MSRTKPPTDIDRLRKKIDHIDTQMAALLKERAHLPSQIILAKELSGTAITDRKRERAIVRRYLSTLKRPIKPKRVHALVKVVLELTPRYRN